MNFSHTLKNELIKQNKQQKHLAEYLGIKTTVINAWINRGNNPKLEHLKKTAEFLNVSVDYLLMGDEDNNKNILSEQEKQLINNFRNLESEKQIELMYFSVKLKNKKN